MLLEVKSAILRRHYERYFRISTCGHLSRAELSLESPLSVPYWPTDYSLVFKVCKWLPVRKSDVFVDYGSGMARVLIVAATRPFKKIIGVEVSSALNAIAVENIRKAKGRLKCQNIEIVCCDAASYHFPDDATVCFFFNPFRGEILKRVFANIQRSLAIGPRQVTILYYNPPGGWQTEANCTWLVPITEFKSDTGFTLTVYVNTINREQETKAQTFVNDR